MIRLKFSNSSHKTVLRCEQKYTYKYVEGLSAKRPAQPLKLGGWLHTLLEAKYALGDWKRTQRRLTAQYNRLWDEEKKFYGDLPSQTSTIMLGYDYYWKLDEGWKILEAEKPIELDLGKGWTYVAKLDVVAENEEGVWVWDHKSFKSKKPTDDYRIIDPQSALYDWAYALLTGIVPVGFIFNYIRTKLPAVPRELKNGGLSRAKNIDTNWITLATTIKHYGLDPADYREELAAARSRDSMFYDRVYIHKDLEVRSVILKDIQDTLPRVRELHNGRRPVRNLTRDCQWDCEYHMLCLTELTGGNGDYIRRHEFVEKAWEEHDESTVIQDSA